ncbi:MAG: L-seryl-tRNA(Sec) selenium transferase [Candidatus Riflebacteria bacterium]|nr:L-seryl-tRNA(Sec) selenium transferase [Candidatus Riflebacteria bacterium]
MKEKLRLIPGVDKLLQDEKISAAVALYGSETIKHSLRSTLDSLRKSILDDQFDDVPGSDEIIEEAIKVSKDISSPSLRRVINATGILIHTNLGRAPIGKRIFEELTETLSGYSNLELNLETGTRGSRSVHVNSILKYITGAEEALVVNNNAAGLILTLSTLAKNKEVIVSRGELIEIGGSFRIPDIMGTSGAKMIEVGTTNRTRISDYENAITADTKILFKAHKSNYSINGFTEEVSLDDLVELAKKRGMIVVYDIGSGLLYKPENIPLSNEPDVKSALSSGVDLVLFSGDKLFGGPQSGIICGRKDLVGRLSKAPLMRALRVCKLTITTLTSVARCYLDEKKIAENLPLFAMLNSTDKQLHQKAKLLYDKLQEKNISSEIIETTGKCGGGTLPDLEIKSFGVVISSSEKSQQKRSDFATRVFHNLLNVEKPILGILRQGELVFDVLTIDEDDIPYIASIIEKAVFERWRT